MNSGPDARVSSFFGQCSDCLGSVRKNVTCHFRTRPGKRGMIGRIAWEIWRRKKRYNRGVQLTWPKIPVGKLCVLRSDVRVPACDTDERIRTCCCCGVSVHLVLEHPSAKLHKDPRVDAFLSLPVESPCIGEDLRRVAFSGKGQN